MQCLLKQGQCYRDSSVIEQLVKALNACQLPAPDIYELQQQVLRRAIDFHTKMSHRQVVSRLSSLLQSCAASSDRLEHVSSSHRTEPALNQVTPRCSLYNQRTVPVTNQRTKKRKWNRIEDDEEAPIASSAALPRTNERQQGEPASDPVASRHPRRRDTADREERALSYRP